MRPHAALRHEVGAPAADDREMYREPDAAFYVGIEVSRSRDYLFIISESHTSTEVRLVGLDRAARDDGGDAVIGEPSLVQPRRPEIEYHLAHTGTSFFILTNDEAVNFRVLEAPIDDPSDRREVIPHRATVKVENVEAFERHLVVVERENGLKRIRVIDLLTRTSRYVAFDEPVYTLWLEHNPEYHSTMLRFSYASLATPRTVFDYDMETETRVRLKQYEVLDGFDPERYVTERIHAASNDGTRIPISLVYRKDTRLGPGTPLVLYGYGAYGVSVEPHFMSTASACSIAASSSRSRISAGAATWAVPGTSTASVSTNATRSRISSRARNTCSTRIHRGGKHRVFGRQGGRAADRRGHEHAPRIWGRGGRGGAVCRRAQHDAGRVLAADGHRIR